MHTFAYLQEIMLMHILVFRLTKEHHRQDIDLKTKGELIKTICHVLAQ